MKPFWKIFLVIFVLAGGGFYWWTKQTGAKPGEAAPTAKSEGKADGKAPGKRGGGPINVTAVKTVRAPMPVVIPGMAFVTLPVKFSSFTTGVFSDTLIILSNDALQPLLRIGRQDFCPTCAAGASWSSASPT